MYMTFGCNPQINFCYFFLSLNLVIFGYYICSVALPRGAVGWSAVCDWGISRSYALTF